MRHKKKSRLAAAEFLAVLIVTAVVFTKGLSAALAWRGYKAVGGEFMLLLLPIIYYEAKRISAFFKLQPGENDIIVEGGTTADVKILWKDRWL